MSRNGAPGMPAWIVLRATSLVLEPHCFRLEEDWLADLFALDGLVHRIHRLPMTEQRWGDVGLSPPTLPKADQTIGIEAGKQSARTLSPLEAQARIAWQRG